MLLQPGGPATTWSCGVTKLHTLPDFTSQSLPEFPQALFFSSRRLNFTGSQAGTCKLPRVVHFDPLRIPAPNPKTASGHFPSSPLHRSSGRGSLFFRTILHCKYATTSGGRTSARDLIFFRPAATRQTHARTNLTTTTSFRDYHETPGAYASSSSLRNNIAVGARVPNRSAIVPSRSAKPNTQLRVCFSRCDVSLASLLCSGFALARGQDVTSCCCWVPRYRQVLQSGRGGGGGSHLSCSVSSILLCSFVQDLAPFSCEPNRSNPRVFFCFCVLCC